jgi:predicted Ser/Thr protein kinase
VNCPSCQSENDADAGECGRCGATLGETAVTETTPIIVSVDLRPGTVFHNRYEIVGPIGKGGMGMVYKARDKSLDEVVAIKVLRPDFAQDPKMADRFKSEIRLARRIRHRNVCGIHDYGEDKGLLYISMEYIEGVDLKHLIRKKGVFPPAEAFDMAIQVSEGLQAVHDAGIIHRDLKTPNIMRDAGGVARLMDFGIAKRKGGETLTATGHIVGTPEYMSPEQAQGHKVDFRSDIYALGIVIYEIFTGRVPFRGETPISTILKHINEPPPLDGPEAAALPPELRAVLRRCLAKEPDDRFSSANELAEALRNARSPSRRQVPMPTEVLRAPTTPERPAVRAAPSRSGAKPWMLAVPLVVVVAGVVGLKGSMRDAPPLVPSPSPVVAEAAPTPAATMAAVSAPGAIPTAPVEAAAPAGEPPVEAAPVPAKAAPAAAPKAGGLAGFGLKPVRPSARPVPAPSAVVATRPETPAATPVPPPPTTAAAAPEGPGMLQVAVKPWGEVSVDGRVIGTTPIDRIALPVGAHTVRVRHPLYEPWERSVNIRSGQVERVLVDLPAQGVRRPN